MRLLYFSPVAWDSYEQRPHYFVRHALTAGAAHVTWINPYPTRLPQLSDLPRLRHTGPGLSLDRPDRLTVVDVTGLPIDPLPGGAWLNTAICWRHPLRALARDADRATTIIGIGRPSALALAALRQVPHAWSFYDAMDAFPEFYRGRSRTFTAHVERQIATSVTRVFASSTALFTKFARVHPAVTLMRNGYDMSLLGSLSIAHENRPRTLCFLGCLGRWFDWSLVLQLAQAVAPVQITLVGPIEAPAPRRLPPNVVWAPACHQHDTLRHLDAAAAGLIPFTLDALTAGIDPVKYYQYRGAGLPVLSTRFGEMTQRDDSDDTFFLESGRLMASVEAAWQARPTRSRIETFRRENSWTGRFTAGAIMSPDAFERKMTQALS